MNSGTFHVMAQEWRYYSREKSLIHTLHLAELVGQRSGDTVLIASTPANPQRGGFKLPPIQLPPQPFFGGAGNIITNEAFVSDCYGCVNWMGQILAQSKMGILVNFAADTISFTPESSGFFMVYVEGQTDLRTLGYNGPNGDGMGTIQILNGGTVVTQISKQVQMVGGGWNANQYIETLLPVHSSTIISAAGTVTCQGVGLGVHTLGNPAYAFVSMSMFKIADWS